MSESRRYDRHNTVKAQVENIIKLKKTGVSKVSIARRYGVSSSFVDSILKTELLRTSSSCTSQPPCPDSL